MNEHAPSEAGSSKLIRWCASHRRLLIAVGVFLFLLVMTGLFDARARHGFDRAVDAIAARGEPVSAAELAAMMPPIPEDENMTLIVLKHAEALTTALETQPEGGEAQQLLFKLPCGPGRHATDEQLQVIRRFLAGIGTDLRAFREALQMERGSLNVDWSSPMVEIELPSVLPLADAGRCLVLDTIAACGDADRERAAADIDDMLDCHRAFEAIPYLLGVLLRQSNMERAHGAIEYAVHTCGLNDEALCRISAGLEEVEHASDFKQALVIERVFHIDTVQMLMRNRWKDPLSWPRGAWRERVPVLPAMDFTQRLQIITDMIDSIEEPDAASLQRLKAATNQANLLPSIYWFSRTSTPSFYACYKLHVRAVARNRAMRVALACERHRMATGDWPDSLDELVPTFIEAIPRDPFSDGLIRYRRIPEGIQVWSLGLDRVEDPGKARDAKGKPVRPETGWLFLNPALRGGSGSGPADRE